MIAANLILAVAVTGGPLDFAKNEFSRYVREVTGREAPAVEFRVDATLDAKHDEYRIVSKDSSVSFTGANGRAVQYAVYDFLERRAGCRWFWDGDMVPKRDAIDYSGLDIREKARFEYRAIRYFAHRGLTRFQAEHWGLEDWKKEIDWCVKRRLNCLMPRIGMDDTWQKAYPDIVPYPDPAKPLPEADRAYNNRSLFWSLEYRGELRRAFTEYAFSRGLMIPTDFGTMTHWYSRTPKAFLEKENPPFLPQASKSYGSPLARVFDIRERKWLDTYWRLTEAFVGAGYGSLDLLHTIGLGERMVFEDRAKNRDFKVDVMKRLFGLAAEKAPKARVLLAGWDFYFKWAPEEVQSLLPELDPDKVLIWDYEADAVRNWNCALQRVNSNFSDWGVVGRFPYTFGIFLAYEQALDIRANYPLIEARQKLVADDPKCEGYILWPEASHTDVFALRYFTANAWNPHGHAATDLLPEFCRDRYGRQAELFRGVWERVIPVSYLLEYWGNYGSILTGSLGKLPEDNYNSRPLTEQIMCFRKAGDVFGELAKVKWTDGFVRRDSIDLARTFLDRRIEMRRLAMLQAFKDWRRKATKAELVEDRTAAFLADVRRMTKLLALHTDFSLYESLRRLDEIRPIVNPEFDRVLVDNAVNDYCRSHQYETAAEVYEPLAQRIAAEIRAKVAAEDRSDLDGDSVRAFRDGLLDGMRGKPLSEMAPKTERTEESFRQLMKELSTRPSLESA